MEEVKAHSMRLMACRLCLNNQRGPVSERENCKQLEEVHSTNKTQSLCTVVHYLCHFLLGCKEVMIGQIHCVWTRDDGQGFGKVVAVWEVQVEHIADL